MSEVQRFSESIVTGSVVNLPQPEPIGWDEALEVGRQGQAMQTAGWLQVAYGAACVDIEYGEESLQEFASELGISHSGAKNQRRVYNRIARLGKDKILSFWPGVQSGAIPYFNILACNPLEDEDFVEVLTLAHDNGWRHKRIAEEVAVRRGKLNPWEVDGEEGGELFQLPPEDVRPAIQKYPELSYHRIGYASDLQLDIMATNLDAMDEDARQRTFADVERNVPGTLAMLAGLPYYGDEEGTPDPHVTLALCPHCEGRGRVKIVHGEANEVVKEIELEGIA